MKTIKVFAPATVANVVCGFDVLGFAVDAPGDEVVMRRWRRFTALVDADLAETLVERLTREPMPGLYLVRHGEVEAKQAMAA